MSDYGKGTITFERGRWRVRVWINGRSKSFGSFATYEEAEQVRDTVLLERVALINATEPTLRSFGARWLDDCADLKSIRGMRAAWGSIVIDAPFIDQPLSSLRTYELQQWARSLPSKPKKRSVLSLGKRTTVELDEPIAHKTATNALGYVSQCLDAAVLAGLIDRNPAAGVKVPRDRKRVEEPITYLSAAEVEQLLGFADIGGGYEDLKPSEQQIKALERRTIERRTVFTIAVCQCPRQGEIAGMDWERVDWDGCGWWIARSWDTSTKNGRTRWQALLPRAMQALREWWMFCGRPTTGIMFPSPHLDDSGALKRYGEGYDWGWSDTYDRNKQRRPGVWRRAGLTTPVRFHDLRDTAATHLLSGTWGEPWKIEVVSKHLGHSSTAITEARYAHMTRTALRDAAQSIKWAPTPAAEPAASIPPTSRKSVKSLAPRVGLEPTTRRLTALSESNDPADLQASRQVPGRFSAELREAAMRLRREVLDGGVADSTIRALAAAYLEESGARDALAALAGGPHVIDHAIRVADAVLDSLDARAESEAG